MRPTLCPFAILLSVSLPSQEQGPERAAADAAAPVVRERSPDEAALDKLLLQAANVQGVAFDARWNWQETAMMAQMVGGAGGGNVRVQRVGNNGNNGNNDTDERHAVGVAYRDMLQARVDGDAARDVVLVGRFVIERLKGGPWRLVDRRRIGMDDPFPDPYLLVLGLRQVGGKVLDRSIAEREGRAVESFSITLDREQLAELVATGAIDDPDSQGTAFRMLAARRNIELGDIGGTTVDVAVDVDVATRQICRLHVRALTKPADARTALNALRGAGRAADPDEEDEAEVHPPAEFRRGLPVRDTEGMEVRELEFALKDHGKLPPLELDEEQRRLLGR